MVRNECFPDTPPWPGRHSTQVLVWIRQCSESLNLNFTCARMETHQYYCLHYNKEWTWVQVHKNIQWRVGTDHSPNWSMHDDYTNINKKKNNSFSWCDYDQLNRKTLCFERKHWCLMQTHRGRSPDFHSTLEIEQKERKE